MKTSFLELFLIITNCVHVSFGGYWRPHSKYYQPGELELENNRERSNPQYNDQRNVLQQRSAESLPPAPNVQYEPSPKINNMEKPEWINDYEFEDKIDKKKDKNSEKDNGKDFNGTEYEERGNYRITAQSPSFVVRGNYRVKNRSPKYEVKGDYRMSGQIPQIEMRGNYYITGKRPVGGKKNGTSEQGFPSGFPGMQFQANYLLASLTKKLSEIGSQNVTSGVSTLKNATEAELQTDKPAEVDYSKLFQK